MPTNPVAGDVVERDPVVANRSSLIGRRKLNTRALAAGVCSSAVAAAAAVAAPAAKASIVNDYYIVSAHCCSTRLYDTYTYSLNHSDLVSLPNWRNGRHNTGIWECAQGRDFTEGHYTSYNCGSAFTYGYETFWSSHRVQALCWTASNNKNPQDTHVIYCDDVHGD